MRSLCIATWDAGSRGKSAGPIWAREARRIILRALVRSRSLSEDRLSAVRRHMLHADGLCA
eukprot:4184770-Pyramimonas_sp.AAC.1